MEVNLGQLVFIRHGEAEKLQPPVHDDDRALTGKGCQAVTSILPDLKYFLGLGMIPRLWSSPKLRAWQTAEIIAAGLGQAEIARQEFIANGDFAAWQQGILRLPPPFCLLIVGHQPHLSDWSQSLSGCLLPFAKGAAAGFRIVSLEPLRAEPLWMIQPRALNLEMADIDAAGPAGGEFVKLLRCQLQEIFRQQAGFLAGPDDPESVHQLRVKIRTLRSLISFIKPLLEQDEYDRIQGSLRDAARKFAHLREIDVLIEQWSELLAIHPLLAGECAALQEVLQVERAAEQAAIYQEVAGGGLAAPLFDTLLWLEGLPAEKDFRTEEDEAVPSLAVFAGKRFASLKRKAKKSFRRTDFQELEDLHALRIRYKKLRYIAACLQPVMPNGEMEGQDGFKAIQDKLGLVVDIRRNMALLQELSRKYERPGLAYASGLLNGYQMRTADRMLRKLKKQ